MADEKCNHCWHETGIMYYSNPPQIEQVCCKCGSKIAYMMYVPKSSSENHGPYHPDKKQELING